MPVLADLVGKRYWEICCWQSLWSSYPPALVVYTSTIVYINWTDDLLLSHRCTQPEPHPVVFQEPFIQIWYRSCRALCSWSMRNSIHAKSAGSSEIFLKCTKPWRRLDWGIIQKTIGTRANKHCTCFRTRQNSSSMSDNGCRKAADVEFYVLQNLYTCSDVDSCPRSASGWHEGLSHPKSPHGHFLLGLLCKHRLQIWEMQVRKLEMQGNKSLKKKVELKS